MHSLTIVDKRNNGSRFRLLHCLYNIVVAAAIQNYLRFICNCYYVFIEDEHKSLARV